MRRSRTLSFQTLPPLPLKLNLRAPHQPARGGSLQRGQAIAFVGARVLVVAHPDERSLQQVDNRRQHLLPAQSAQSQMLLHFSSDGRQAFREGQGAMILRALPDLAEPGVVPILLAASGIAPRRLDVPIGLRADPDLGPGGRHRQSFDPLQCGGVLDAFARIALVSEPLARPSAADARFLIADTDPA